MLLAAMAQHIIHFEPNGRVQTTRERIKCRVEVLSSFAAIVALRDEFGACKDRNQGSRQKQSEGGVKRISRVPVFLLPVNLLHFGLV